MKKVKVLALIMVFAFAALGGAYAMWYDTLFVDENVSTGVVNLTWHCAQSSDEGPNYTGFTNAGVFGGSLDRRDPDNPNEAKNVGSKDFTITNDAEVLPTIEGTDNRNENDILTLTLSNGYPGYQEYVQAQVQNLGTVPTKFQVKLADGDEIPTWMHFQIVDSTGKVIYDNKDATKTGLEGMQIEPGQCVCLKFVERILQEAPQNASASFELQLKGVQWNEYNFALPGAITAGE
ncbi:MAG: hypothetical protein ABFC94_14015 [Syntrophomonas sp.]